jgi:hypothetical protein
MEGKQPIKVINFLKRGLKMEETIVKDHRDDPN